MINSRFVSLIIIITGFVCTVLVIFPELDVIFSNFFYSQENDFIYKNNFFVDQIYKILPIFTKIFTLLCLSYLAIITIKYRNFRKILASGVFFLLVSAIMGPGIVVNGVFKENFGRARPSQINVFGGAKEFTPAFKITDQCKTNCSFSSGHASMAFFFSAIAYLMNLKYFRKIYLLGLIFGSLVGLSRIMMGGHFLSDVVVSAFIVLLLNHLIFILWQKILQKYP